MTDDDSGKKSAATTLVGLAEDRYQFGVSTDGEVFAVALMDAPVVRLLRGGRAGLRAELADAYYQQCGKAAPQQALADALLVLEGKACRQEPEQLWQRVGRSAAGSWYVDLGDQTGDGIRVDPTGWKITAPPMKFRRTALTAALPRPTTGGSLEDLWGLLNIATADRPLVLAWLVSTLIADIPHPILDLAGEQGTGKSTAAKLLVSLIDPSPVPLRKSPRDADSWVTAAAGSWIVAVDNVSTISDWLSDSLCRAVTGDGDVRRQLYTDGGLAVFSFRRCLVLNGIDLGAVRGDLADRLLVIDLDVIDEQQRRLDADISQRWDSVQPRILGALLDLAASVASALPSVRLERSPRMADFARVLAAVDQVLGTDGLHRYLDRGRYLATDALSADPFVLALAAQLTGEFHGTSAQLLDLITAEDDRRPPKGWPANARQLTTLLKRQAPVMRRAGWVVEEAAPGHDNALRWRIARPEIAGISRSQASRHSQPTGPGPTTASVASVASDEYEPSQDDDPISPAAPAGNPLCSICGKANLFHPATIARGTCAHCVGFVGVAS